MYLCSFIGIKHVNQTYSYKLKDNNNRVGLVFRKKIKWISHIMQSFQNWKVTITPKLLYLIINQTFMKNNHFTLFAFVCFPR